MNPIFIPWYPACLSPNYKNRKDVYGKANARKKYRRDCIIACRAAKVGTIDADAVHATVTFHPPNNQPRDIDNCLSSVKNGLDGIAEAIGVDDSNWAITIRKGEKVEGGIVTVELEPTELVLIPFRGFLQ